MRSETSNTRKTAAAVTSDDMTRSVILAKMSLMRYSVIIPAYNEARSLPVLLSKFPKGIPITVIDDGSVDQTSKVAKANGARVVRNKRNMGVGLSIRAALRNAARNKDVIVIMDADGQHDPKYIPIFLKAIREGADYVIGSRYATQTPSSTSWLRILGSKVISLWLWIWFRRRICDPTSGFRVMGPRAYSVLSRRYPTFFPEPESIITILTHKLTVCEEPCIMKQRIYGKSSISLWKASVLMAYILFRIPQRAIAEFFRSG